MSEEKPVVPDAKDEPKNLDPEIQARDIKWRAHAKTLAEENESLKSTLAKEKAELLSKIDHSAKAQKDLQKKVLDAEIKAHAVAAGLQDLDFVKMIDVQNIVVKEDGSIEGIQKAVEDLKMAKPILFGAEKKTSSSKGATLPNKTQEPVIDAFKMSDEEYLAQKARLGI